MGSMDLSKLLKNIPELPKFVLSIDQFDNFERKNASLSSQVRSEGNNLFKQKKHDEKTHLLVLQAYTKSIALAVEDSEEQALAYSNRSVLLMHLQKYKKCLIDVNRALKITQSEDLKKKLLLRKEKCLPLIDQNDGKNSQKSEEQCSQLDVAFLSSNSALQQMDALLTDPILREGFNLPKKGTLDDLEERFKKVKVPKIVSANESIPNYSKCLTIKNNKKYGRHVMATRDIKPGEILAIEKGYVFPKNHKIYISCSNCLNFTWNGIPCAHCVYAVYCSEKCKAKAWEEYHDVECSILGALFSGTFAGYLSHIMLTLRLFIIFVKSEGLQSMIDQANSIDKDKEAHVSGFFTNGKFDSTKFRSIYNLLNFEGDVKKPGTDEFGTAIMILLDKYTRIYKDHKYTQSMETLMLQIRNIIIRFKTTVDHYAACFMDTTCDCKMEDRRKCTRECPKNLGTILTPCSSLINHSCNANACAISCKGGKRIVFSIRPIKKNEQIFLGYIGGFTKYPKIERQSILKFYYHFSCDCEACKNNWPQDSDDYSDEFSKTAAKISMEIIKFTIEAKLNKVENHQLMVLIKWIELGFKYLSNYDASRFTDGYVDHLQRCINKLYGIEVKIPNKC